MTAKVAIMGFGKLGKGVLTALGSARDMEPTYIVTRRDPTSIKENNGVKVIGTEELKAVKSDIDVLILCTGSLNDLPTMSPMLAAEFNTVDSYDDHTSVTRHFDAVSVAAMRSRHTAIVSAGWDPGLMSVTRLIGQAVLPGGDGLTLWGPGVSQGHSNALASIPGVTDAIQYTVPIPSAEDEFKSGKRFSDPMHECHRRICYIATDEGADRKRIEKAILSMPGYFEGYDVEVHFTTAEELVRIRKSGYPHGGKVIRTGKTSDGSTHTLEFALSLGSNPAFTGSVTVAYARAAVRLFREGRFGGFTPFDIPPAYLSELSNVYQRTKLL